MYLSPTRRLSQAALFGAAVLGVALAAAPASAGPVTVTSVASNKGEALNLNTPVSITAEVGQLLLTTVEYGTIAAWCIDLYHDISLGSNTYAYGTGTIATDSNGTTLTALQVAEIAGLIVHGDALLAGGGGTSDDSAATQLAIWSVEYPSFTYSGGPVAETNALIALAPSLAGSATALIALRGQQGLATASPVPEPASLALLGIGIASVGALRRRR